MYNIVQKRIYFYIFSGTLVVLSLLAIFIWKPNIGIDFLGGGIMEISAPNLANSADKIKNQAEISGVDVNSTTTSGSDIVTLRMATLTTDQHNKLLSDLKSSVNPNISENSYQNIGPVISKDLTNKAIWAVVVASLTIILYIAFAFRKVPKPMSSWMFGLTAVVALLHDLIVTSGFVTIIGHFYKFMQVDTLFITALLTIMGFSVHDTIVVFDRLRENAIKHPGSGIETLANDSIMQTISRSINTSLTTIMVLVALFVLGGESISGFVLTLIAGITFGTYSSIFIATMLLVSWNKTTKAANSK